MKESLSTRTLLAVFKIFAHLPLRAMYVFSDIAFFLIYYIARYRRKIVDENLGNCFPQKRRPNGILSADSSTAIFAIPL